MILVHQTLEVMDLVNLYVKLLTVRGNISKTIAMADLFLASLDKLTKGRVLHNKIPSISDYSK